MITAIIMMQRPGRFAPVKKVVGEINLQPRFL